MSGKGGSGTVAVRGASAHRAGSRAGAQRPGREVAVRVLDAYREFQDDFLAITRRAGGRFGDRAWRGAQDDATERLLLYRRRLDGLLPELAAGLGRRSADPGVWRAAKSAYAWRAAAGPDTELALTFFNSVSRRALDTVGVNPDVEFLGDELPRHRPSPGDPELLPYPLAETGGGGSTPGRGAAAGVSEVRVRRVLEELALAAPFGDLAAEARRVGGALAARLAAGIRPDGPPEGTGGRPIRLELLPDLFYRNKGAYAVGRLKWAGGTLPVVLALLHGPGGVTVDALLTSSDDMSVVFGFSRSYFHVEVVRPRELVAFLRSLMPRKRIDELYNGLGYDRHGKTELYRTLRERLERSSARFEIAEGEPGLVMSVFTLEGLDVVFKVIKDRFPPQKRVTPAHVKDRYRMVYVRDRVGRLADAQLFEHLEINGERFAPELLDRLLEAAPETVKVEEDRVVIEHLYAVRRMTPLNLYLERADPDRALAAILDYGQAIRDLAAADVFPGDLLLKNFGVSRHGRVIFYDYDELTRLTACRFRSLPDARRPEEELAAEPWYYVGPDDLFPEEFPRFLGIPDRLREPFLRRHGELFEPDFWRDMQARHRAGEVADFFPYPRERRLGPDAGATRASG